MNISSLTGVRGFAAVWVVLFHIQAFAGELGVAPLAGLPVLRSGWAGVDLFFVLSGFVLMLAHESDFRRLTWPALGRFAWLRAFRIYPLATVVLLLIFILVTADPVFRAWFVTSAVPPNLTVSAFFRTLFLATRWWTPTDGDWNQPVWSLSVELLGYVAFPFIAFIATRIRRPWLLAALALVCLLYPSVMAYLSQQRLYNDDIFWGAGQRMAGGFTAGIVLCRLHGLTPERWRQVQGRLADLALVALLICLLAPARTGATTVCFGVLVYGLAADRGYANTVFSTPVAMFLGRISFPLYLLHVMVLTWLRFGLVRVQAPEWGRLVAVGLFVVFCLAASWLLHNWVEKPAHAFARASLGGRRTGVAAPLAAPTANG